MAGESGPGPNSERGHLFVDLDAPVAAGWESSVLIMGPSNGEEICRESIGCYGDHHALSAHEVRVTGEEGAIEVVAFREVELMGVPGAEVVLRALVPGQARVELSFDIEGMEPPVEESEEPGGAPPEHFVDAFEVEVRELARVELRRTSGGVDPQGRYGRCPVQGAGAYVFDDPTEVAIFIEQRKLDGDGELLRGSGAFAFEVDPEDALAVFDGEESLHQVRLEPARAGRVSLVDDQGEAQLTFLLSRPSEVDGAQPRMVEITAEGQRGLVVNRMVQGRYYELQLGPTVGGAPLCGGDAVVQKQVMTPVTCELVNGPTSHSEQLVRALNPGECWVRFVAAEANGGRGISVDFQLDVDPGSPTHPGR
ncbi:hypothetical protein DL240_03105 [Lujinxingia litoralis]|uniref:Uncharacterized protein n=1 Tax=Lujinxingia litoralis TaxID=2211119 RepID=A0A328CEA5_9DELT|nr:hypothetical protein DL240_03105 [Lujinxingia litoralis]